MNNNRFINGFVVLGTGLLASSLSSFLDHFAIFGSATDLLRGFFAGLSVVAFVVAIVLLARSRRTSRE